MQAVRLKSLAYGYDYVVRRGNECPVQTEKFPDYPLYPVALCRFPKSVYADSQPIFIPAVWHINDCEFFAPQPPASFIDMFVFPRFPYQTGFRQGKAFAGVCHYAPGWNACAINFPIPGRLYGQALTPPGSFSIDNRPAGFGFHSGTEPVFAVFFKIAWLKCSFHCYIPFYSILYPQGISFVRADKLLNSALYVSCRRYYSQLCCCLHQASFLPASGKGSINSPYESKTPYIIIEPPACQSFSLDTQGAFYPTGRNEALRMVGNTKDSKLTAVREYNLFRLVES